jgi:dienelactone hydrolase
MKKMQIKNWILVMVVALSACTVAEEDTGNQVVESQPTSPPTLTRVPSETPPPTFTYTPSPTDTPSATPVVVLPAEPIEIQFEAADGQELTGLYYPAEENPAPILVLMTWTKGNQSEWEEIAYWLQGRGLFVREPDYRRPWKSSNWYPKRIIDMPLGVFTFNFRSCEGEDGCQAYQPAEWLLDAQAALETASRLDGIDPGKIITAGASIGADAAVYSCAWVNTADLGTCLGSFTLSPSSSLTVDFSSSVDALLAQENPASIYCLFGLQDEAAQETCGDYPGIKSIHFGYIENHGFELIIFDRTPAPLDHFQQFILDSLGGAQ